MSKNATPKAHDLIVRATLEKMKDTLPISVRAHLNNPEWTATDLTDLLHEEAENNPEVARKWMAFLRENPYKMERDTPQMDRLFQPKEGETYEME